jgi:hypothetical protein
MRLKKKKYFTGTKGLNDGFSDLVPGNTTQYAPNENYFTDMNASASNNSNTIDYGKRNVSQLQNKVLSKNNVNSYLYRVPKDKYFDRNYFENDDFQQDILNKYFERQKMLENERQQLLNNYYRRPSSESYIMTGTQTSTRSKLDVPEKLSLKTPTFSFNPELPKPVVKPVDVNSTEIKETSPKPTQQFARYPGMKKGFFGTLKDKISGLMQSRMVNSRRVGNITATGPSFVSGAKSVKQYRGDENLPEAKNGMKNCGCKHPKTKYKRGTKGLTDPPPAKIYEKIYNDEEGNYFKVIPNSKAGAPFNRIRVDKEGNPYPLDKQFRGDQLSATFWADRVTPSRTRNAVNINNESTEEIVPFENTWANVMQSRYPELYKDLGSPVWVSQNADYSPNVIYKRGSETEEEAFLRAGKEISEDLERQHQKEKENSKKFLEIEESKNQKNQPVVKEEKPNLLDRVAFNTKRLFRGSPKYMKGKNAKFSFQPEEMPQQSPKPVDYTPNFEDEGKWYGEVRPTPKNSNVEYLSPKTFSGTLANQEVSQNKPNLLNVNSFQDNNMYGEIRPQETVKQSKPSPKYLAFKDMTKSQQEQYRRGMAGKEKFTIDGAEYAAPSSKQRQHSNRMQRLYKKNPELYNKIITKTLPFKEGTKKLNKYKYGTGALTIPEGSAIVTANGGKNKQALAAYKKGNYKLLNKIIDQMPEDNVDKAQAGEKEVIGGKQSFEVRASKKGKIKNRLDMTKTAQDEIWQGKNYDEKWIPEVEAALKDPKRYQKVLEYFKNYQGQDKETVQRIIKLAESKSPEEVKYAIKKLGTDRNIGPFHTTLREAIKPETPPKTPPPPPEVTPNVTPKLPEKINTPQDEYEEINAGEIKPAIPAISLGETGALTGLLARGVPAGPRESYLNLDRYKYQSQLPKSLREIQLAEQRGRETSRDVLGGDAGRYLAQSSNLSAAGMKAANEAVIADTLARQDILNKNVDLTNTELTTNRSLKDYYDDIKRQNINDYNALLVKAGQSFDESFDTWQKMKNENQLKAQELQLLQESNSNYTMVRDPKTGLMKSVYRFKKKPSSTQTPLEKASGIYDFNTRSGEFNFDPSNFSTENISKKGIKKAKTYKRK